ncbi:TetR/AcrR family transcriptional regulator [Pseudonocardia sp. TRM90224]|uniref:TetR/AcrR family transcriptional regulator n=1 Tax=Pseudonocardia sp. TRM90224 TaxID=2812678 RepID=UPI001E56E4C9|nr:TetR family transcriptional regulator [Pseudonocardia sp. TRM90224]
MRVNEGARTFTTEARRRQIVDAAITTIAELGLAKASFARIAERGGLSSTRMISYHFADRDDLLEAVVARVFELAGDYMAPYVLSQERPPDQLRAFIESSTAWFAAYREHVIAVREVWFGLRDADGNLRYGMAHHERGIVVLTEIFRNGQRSGEFRDFDPRVMSVTLRHALDGLSGQVAEDPDLDVAVYTSELVALFTAATEARS